MTHKLYIVVDIKNLPNLIQKLDIVQAKSENDSYF